MANLETAALSFRNDLMVLTQNIVWKNQYQAIQGEEQNSSGNPDEYVWAAQRLMEEYTTSQLIRLIEYDDVKFNSLLETADDVLKKPLRILRLYEEENDYYRMLYGKPPHHRDIWQEDKTEYYIPISELGLTNKIINSLGLAPIYETGYVHDLTKAQASYLESTGYLQRLWRLYGEDKNYEYLFHLTDKKIYPFIARMAQPFDLLYIPKSKIESLSKDFVAVYDRSKTFVIQRYYSDAYRNRYEFYEGFMGLAILFMTMQQMNVMYLDTDITREFYDLDSLKAVYEAYSVPFYESIPISYHAKVVKAINRLLSYKGSNQIFFDLAALFDYGKLTVFQYYLMKTQKLNQDGTPYFQYDDIYDKNGVLLDRELNYEGTYDINFVRRALRKESPYEAVNNESNYLDYVPVILEDPYWIHDADLAEKMYRSEYNFIETKYIGFEVEFSMTQYFYETLYYLRILFDNKDLFSKIYIPNDRVGADITIFNAVIYLHALICKKLGWIEDFDRHRVPDISYLGKERCKTCYGELPHEPTKIAKLMGYNFRADIQLIVNECLVADCRHSIQYVNKDKTGFYFYPVAKRVGSKEKVTSIAVTASTWESLDIYIYEMREGNIIKCLGTYEGYQIIDDGDESMWGRLGYGLDSKAADIIDTCLRMLGLDDVTISELRAECVIKVKDASIEMFDSSLDKQEFIDMITGIDIDDAVTINNRLGIASTYRGIIAIKEYIENKMLSTNDKEVYYAFKHLHKVLMTTDVLEDIITKTNPVKEPIYETDENGNIVYHTNIFGEEVPVIKRYEVSDPPRYELATSYADLLEDLDMLLAVRLMNLDTDDELRSEIDYLLIQFENLIEGFKYTTAYGSYNKEVVVEYLYNLLRFFKSVKVQLLDFNIIWVFDSRTDNLLKLMTEFRIAYRKSKIEEDTSLAIGTFDFIQYIYDLGLINESLTAKDVMLQFTMLVHLKSLVIKEDGIKYQRIKEILNEFANFFDSMADAEMIRIFANELNEFRTLLNMIDETQYYQMIHLKSSLLFTEMDKLAYRWMQVTMYYAGLIHFSSDIIHNTMNRDVGNFDFLSISSDAVHQSLMVGPTRFDRGYYYMLWDDDDIRYYVDATNTYTLYHDMFGRGVGVGVLASEDELALVFDLELADGSTEEFLMYNGRDDYIGTTNQPDLYYERYGTTPGIGVYSSEDWYGLVFGGPDEEDEYLLYADNGVRGDDTVYADLYWNKTDGAGEGVFSSEDFEALVFWDYDWRAPYAVITFKDGFQGRSLENGFNRLYRELQNTGCITLTQALIEFHLMKRPEDTVYFKDLCVLTDYTITYSDVGFAIPDPLNKTENEDTVMTDEDTNVLSESVTEEYHLSDFDE